MTAAEHYRRRAAELKAEASAEPEWTSKCRLEVLALSYLRLATEADRNSIPKDIVYETPVRPATSG